MPRFIERREREFSAGNVWVTVPDTPNVTASRASKSSRGYHRRRNTSGADFIEGLRRKDTFIHRDERLRHRCDARVAGRFRKFLIRALPQSSVNPNVRAALAVLASAIFFHLPRESPRPPSGCKVYWRYVRSSLCLNRRYVRAVCLEHESVGEHGIKNRFLLPAVAVGESTAERKAETEFHQFRGDLDAPGKRMDDAPGRREPDLFNDDPQFIEGAAAVYYHGKTGLARNSDLATEEPLLQLERPVSVFCPARSRLATAPRSLA